MAYDEGLAQRIREIMDAIPGTSEKKMFGGLAFLVNGNMCVGVVKDELMVRVGPEQYEKALSEPAARPMDFTGKPMEGFVFVSEAGIESDEDLRKWIELAYAYVKGMKEK